MKVFKYIFLIFLGTCFSSCSTQEKPPSEENILRLKVDSTLLNFRNERVIESIREYIQNNSEGVPRVYTMVIKRDGLLTTSFTLCSITTYNELSKSIPTGYFLIDNKVVLVYTGLEKLQQPDQKFVNELKYVIGDDLENNLLPDGTLDPNYNARIFDPWAWEIKLVKDSLIINKDSARNVLGPPVVEVIKFVPPKEEK